MRFIIVKRLGFASFVTIRMEWKTSLICCGFQHSFVSPWKSLWTELSIWKTFLQTESASLNFILHGILIPFPELIKSESYLKFLLPHLHAIVNWISLMYQDRFDKNLFDFFSLFPSAKNSLAFKLNFLFPSGTFLEWINLSQSAINLIWKIFLISFFR